MNSLVTPGLYRLPALPVRATGPLARGDVALFLGYAVRGPVGIPVRVESPTRFETLFGPRPADGFLWPAIKGFFETGGAAAYVLRLVDGTATEATAELGEWTARASFPWPMIDPRRVRGAARAAAAAWVQLIEAQMRDHGMRSPDPGIWGNGLVVDISRSPMARTEVVPDDTGDANTLTLASLSGIELASVLELSQAMEGDGTHVEHLQPEVVDRARRRIRLPRTLAQMNFRDGSAIHVSTVEFRLEVRLNGRIEQSFPTLAPDPRHGRSLADTLGRECRSLHLVAPQATDWSQQVNWPETGSFALRGGSDGLTQMSARVWLDSCNAIRRLSEPALIAMPDLVLPAAEPRPALEPIPEKRDCSDIALPPSGRLHGRVTGSGKPVAFARIDIDGEGGQTSSDRNGQFSVTGIPVGLVTLRIVQQGFEPFEAIVQSTALDMPRVDYDLQPLTAPTALSELDILMITQALANPDEVGPYKILIADPPSPTTKLDELRSWRSRLGDTARICLFGPWLRVPGPAGAQTLVSVPPSGHICGAFAAAELEAGIQRSGANRPLRYVEGLTLAIDDGEQGLLNPIGINAIRAYPGRGIRANGSRTLSSETEWRFLTTRRIVDAIEKTLESGLAWLAFEPNNLFTRHTATVTVWTFLDQLWRAGVLAGDEPQAAYSIKCDTDNNNEEDEAQGRLTIDIGVAPSEPYEFVLFRLGSAQDALKVTE